MSTWIHNPNDQKYACFSCRKCFNGKSTKCPNCGNKIHAMGTVFKAPKRRNYQQWKTVELLWYGGVRYEHDNLRTPIYHDSYIPEESSVEMLIRNMKTYTIENPVWQLPLYQFSGPHPTHLRDVEVYLDWWWEKIRIHVSGISELCVKFDIPEPTVIEHEDVRGWLNLEKENTT